MSKVINLPKQYQWLTKDGMPKMIVEALKEYGTIETPGQGNNPKIIAWGKEVSEDVAKIYKTDDIPWCGLFMAVVAKRAGKKPVNSPLWALNWGAFGKHTDCPAIGDVLVFVRRTANGSKAGHVALYVGEDKASYHCLGGNQADSVCFTRMAKNRLYTARRPDYNIIPDSVKTVYLTATGSLSTNEA